MAHEIGEMFWCGDEPWHGLGRELREPATLEEALSAGGLDWQVALVPLQTADGAENSVPQRRAVVRTDVPRGDRRRVLGVVHPDFSARCRGFREAASTILNEAGFRGDVIERQLAHCERGEIRGAYNRAECLSERRKMMQQ